MGFGLILLVSTKQINSEELWVKAEGEAVLTEIRIEVFCMKSQTLKLNSKYFSVFYYNVRY